MSCYAEYFEFFPGEDKTILIGLTEANRTTDCRDSFDLTDATSIKVHIPAPVEIVVDGVVEGSPVKGRVKADLSAIQTERMVSGAVVVKVVKNGKTRIFVAGGVKRLSIGTC